MSDLDNTFSRNSMESYLKKLYKNLQIKEGQPMNFHNGYYLKYQTTDEIFKALDKYFQNEFKLSNSTVHLIKTADFDRHYNYSFLIKDEDDLQYAMNLVKLYKYLFRPLFTNTIKIDIMRNSEFYFNRFFYFAHNLITKKVPGKTIHYTDETYRLKIHGALDINEAEVQYQHGHVSHFRPKYSHYFSYQGIKVFPIKALALDINYFYIHYSENLKRNLL